MSKAPELRERKIPLFLERPADDSVPFVRTPGLEGPACDSSGDLGRFRRGDRVGPRPTPGPVLPPGLSEAERARQIQERDQIRAEMVKLAQAGKLDEAVAASVKELAATREVRGELHEDVVASLQCLAWLQEAREDWAAARKSLTEVLAIRQRQPDQKDWRIADARRALADLDRRATLSPAQRQRLQEADRLNRLQDALSSRGNMRMESIRAARPWKSGESYSARTTPTMPAA